MAFNTHILRTSLDELDREALIEIIIEQARKLHQQQEQLEEQLEQAQQAERQGKRGAAPFKQPPHKRTATPNRPGRKGGHTGQFRARPQRIDETIEVPLSQCPHCQGPVAQLRPLRQVIEEIPRVAVQVTELITYRGQCPQCGPVTSTHPLQQSQATGAAAVQLGPNAQALAAELIFDLGLTRRKASRLLAQRFGLRISAGGLQHVAHRLAHRLRPRYAALKGQLAQAAVVYADETSWYVGTAGGEPRAWLWVFAHAEATIYRVERTRARAIITQTLGQDFAGVLVSDCLNIYDEATPLQHKCYAHHLKAIRQQRAGAEAAGVSTVWLDQVRGLLQAAMALKRAGDLPGPVYRRYCVQLEQRADVLLAAAGVSSYEQAIRLRLSKQRDHLFTFLYHGAVEATNNLAERQLRPAVITRKLMCGNRSARGAVTWSVLTSLAATARQQGSTLAQWIMYELQGPLPTTQTR